MHAVTDIPHEAPAAWIVGDGTLRAETIKVKIERIHNSDPDGVMDSPSQYGDKWEISFGHSNGRGASQRSTFTYEFGHYDWSNWVKLVSISDGASSIDFDTSKGNSTRNVSDTHDKCLQRLAKAIQSQVFAAVGWEHTSQSPLRGSGHPGQILTAELPELVIQTGEPRRRAVVDAAGYLSDALADNTTDLSHRMVEAAEYMSDDSAENISELLDMRYDEIRSTVEHYGIDLSDTVRTLVENGMMRTPHLVDYGDEDKQLECYLRYACLVGATDDAAVLVRNGWDPLLSFQPVPEQPSKCALMVAAESGHIDVLAAIIENSPLERQPEIISFLRAHFADVAEFERARKIELYPTSEPTFGFVAALCARQAIRATTARAAARAAP